MPVTKPKTESLLVKALLQHLERRDGKLQLGPEQTALSATLTQFKSSPQLRGELEEAIGFAHFLATHKQEPTAADQIMQLLTAVFAKNK